MNFERHIDPKISLGVGLHSIAIEPIRCSVKFQIDKDNEINHKPIDSQYMIEFLEMWEKGKFKNNSLLKILNLRGFFRGLTTIQISEIHLKLSDFDIGGNYVGSKPGSGKTIYVKYLGKLYILPVESHHQYFLV